MPRPSLIDTLVVEKVALLAARGKSQKEIGELLKLGQSTISRAMSRSRECGLLVDRLECTLPPERAHAVEGLLYAGGLEDRLKCATSLAKQRFMGLKIIDCRTPNGVESAAAFGRAAGLYAAGELIPGTRMIGVTWGQTLSHLIPGVEKSWREDKQSSTERRILPVCGDPPQVHRDPSRSSAILASNLGRALGCSSDNEYSFSGVVAAISCTFTSQEVRTIRKFFLQISGYCSVFGEGDRSGLIDEVDTVFTGAGNRSLTQDRWVGEAAELAGIKDVQELEDATCGNLGGFFIERADATPRQKRLVDSVNRRWTGISLEQFDRCARAASGGKAIGVVLFVQGPRKADVTLECIQRGLVNRVVIDHELALELVSRLG